MHTNIGFYNEVEMIMMFNNKKFSELSNNGKYIIREIYGHPHDDDIIHARKVEEFIKPDFIVEMNGVEHFISMKSGSSEALHQEYVKNFCAFLKDNDISDETIETILLYQYGDGTLDGTGKERMEYNQLRYVLSERINNANKDLNVNKEFVLNVINRVIFKGTNINNQEADYLYHGNTDYGILVSKGQMMKHCSRKDWDWMNNLHIGPLQLRPHARYIGKPIIKPLSRERLEFYWAKYYADLEYISKRYDG